jgi:hypothetical protein
VSAGVTDAAICGTYRDPHFGELLVEGRNLAVAKD